MAPQGRKFQRPSGTCPCPSWLLSSRALQSPKFDGIRRPGLAIVSGPPVVELVRHGNETGMNLQVESKVLSLYASNAELWAAAPNGSNKDIDQNELPQPHSSMKQSCFLQHGALVALFGRENFWAPGQLTRSTLWMKKPGSFEPSQGQGLSYSTGCSALDEGWCCDQAQPPKANAPSFSNDTLGTVNHCASLG